MLDGHQVSAALSWLSRATELTHNLLYLGNSTSCSRLLDLRSLSQLRQRKVSSFSRSLLFDPTPTRLNSLREIRNYSPRSWRTSELSKIWERELERKRGRFSSSD
jgi:hypothetical protein